MEARDGRANALRFGIVVERMRYGWKLKRKKRITTRGKHGHRLPLPSSCVADPQRGAGGGKSRDARLDCPFATAPDGIPGSFHLDLKRLPSRPEHGRIGLGLNQEEQQESGGNERHGSSGEAPPRNQVSRCEGRGGMKGAVGKQGQKWVFAMFPLTIHERQKLLRKLRQP